MMSYRNLYLSLGLILLVMALSWSWQKIGRRTGALRVRHFAFPSAWLRILEENVPLYRRLPVDLRDRLQDRITTFVDGKRWKHCGGLDAVSDEMKVTVAGQACFLLLGRAPAQDFARVLNVMIYPSSSLEGAMGDDAMPPVEAWPTSSVLLAWDEVKKSARDVRDVRNQVLHDFAHQLDMEDGIADGRPILTDHCQHTAWARVMSQPFLHDEPLSAGDVLGCLFKRGDPAEVFAAATEVFFQSPEDLQRRHPEVYALLRAFYKLDPARWLKH
jgi:Mlc titration factor MtfA (ptsG expression regulator)